MIDSADFNRSARRAEEDVWRIGISKPVEITTGQEQRHVRCRFALTDDGEQVTSTYITEGVRAKAKDD